MVCLCCTGGGPNVVCLAVLRPQCARSAHSWRGRWMHRMCCCIPTGARWTGRRALRWIHSLGKTIGKEFCWTPPRTCYVLLAPVIFVQVFQSILSVFTCTGVNLRGVGGGTPCNFFFFFATELKRGKWKHMTTGIRSEKCVVRRFRRATARECTYTNLDSTV